MSEIGYAALFVSSLLASTLLPLSSEPLLIAMVLKEFSPTGVVVVATIGNWIGSMISYGMGYAGNIEHIEKWLKIKSDKIDRFRAKTEKYGAWFGLLTWVPGIGDILAVCLGVVRARVVPTAIMILIGKAARYAVIAYLTYSTAQHMAS